MVTIYIVLSTTTPMFVNGLILSVQRVSAYYDYSVGPTPSLLTAKFQRKLEKYLGFGIGTFLST